MIAEWCSKELLVGVGEVYAAQTLGFAKKWLRVVGILSFDTSFLLKLVMT